MLNVPKKPGATPEKRFNTPGVGDKSVPKRRRDHQNHPRDEEHHNSLDGGTIAGRREISLRNEERVTEKLERAEDLGIDNVPKVKEPYNEHNWQRYTLTSTPEETDENLSMKPKSKPKKIGRGLIDKDLQIRYFGNERR